MKELIELSAGNPGAVNALMNLKLSGTAEARKILDIIESIPTLRGTNVYVLFSDLGGNDVNRVYRLCTECPADILEDACSRQDYSGRQLVEPYLK